MRPLVRCHESLTLDVEVQKLYALSVDVLMEAAALGMVNALRASPDLASRLDRVVALCGRGNNGGDALAVLRHLVFAGYDPPVAVVLAGPGLVTARRLDEARRAGVRVVAADDAAEVATAVSGASLMLDGLAGAGYSGPRRPELTALCELVAGADCPVVAIDVPSGTGPSHPGAESVPPLRATHTLCVTPLKAELYYPGNRPSAGVIIPVEDVFPVRPPRGSTSSPSTDLLCAEDLGSLLPDSDPDCHKGGRGAVSVFAGNRGTAGAAVLACRSAAAAGAGSVTLLVREELLPVLGAQLVETMVRPVTDPGTRRFDACLAGPGWGADERNAATLATLYDAAIPLVLDADALHLLAAGTYGTRCSPLVLTPHPGEALSLLVIATGGTVDDPEALDLARRRLELDTASAALDIAVRWGAVVVLKGAVTWIVTPDGTSRVWDGRNAMLATAGSGDVLAGTIGALLARGLNAVDAATAGVILHGMAGNEAGRHGFFPAGDLVQYIALIAGGGTHG